MVDITAVRGRIELPILIACVIVAGGFYGFVELMEVARNATPHDFDTSILLALRVAGDPSTPIGPPWLQEAVRDITALGSMSVLVFICVSVVLYLFIARRPAAALFLAGSVIGGQILSTLLKLGVDRPRPDLVPHLMDVFTLSFPSGHAMLSAVTYLTLGALLARVSAGRAMKIYVLCVAVLATFLVGASRVYLGVHWPSDVLAGWCAGAAWAMLCWLVAQWFLRRGRSAALPD